ncbi:MAG: ATP-dependent helicase C-terminal domain-containing protein, partial [Planctomycetota bacterium]
AESSGDLLVFLPGMYEIRAAQDALTPLARRSAAVLMPLHGSLGPEEQDRVLRPGEQRKIVLATNLAESSLTIPGVTAVIDSGLARVLRHDPGRGLDQLRMEDISMASAQQRAGRAGRTGPGVCYRLWSKAEERARPATSSPEIKRVDLSAAILQVHAFAGRPAQEFRWFEAPEPSALERGEQLLEMLQAIRGGKLTGIGEELLRLPLHPRLGRMMLEARRLGCARSAGFVAALVSERDIRRDRGSVDLDPLLEALQAASDGRSLRSIAEQYDLQPSGLDQIMRVQRQITGSEAEDRDSASLGPAILAAFPDRLFRLRATGARDGVMVGGRGLVLTADSDCGGELFIALQIRDAGGRGAKARVELLSPVELEWLQEIHPQALQEVQLVDWDEPRQKLVPRRELRFFDLVISQTAGGNPSPEEVTALLRTRIGDDPWAFLEDSPELRGFLDRLAWLRQRTPDLGLPQIGNEELAELLASLGSGVRSLKELRSLKILPALRSTLGSAAMAGLARSAPERVELPSGRRVRIDYSGAEPSVAGKIQEFFGSVSGPRLPGSGQILVLHLLGPNQRPLQITRDLASFWRQIYPGLRLEMKRRYPRHSWPEDPLEAQPESGPKRRRRS